MTKILTIIIYILSFFHHLVHSKYIPSFRFSTSSFLDKDNKLYFIGGSDLSKNCLNDVFYIDLSKSFNLAEQEFEETTKIPENFCLSSSSFAEGGNKIYIFGELNNSLVYSFDTNTKQWNIPQLNGIPPEKRSHIQMISDNDKNNLYIFGGLNENMKFFNDMNIIKSKDFTWNNIISNDVILPYLSDYTATMLSTGEIVYIGGKQSDSSNGTNVIFTKMNEAYVFDTISSSWSIINIEGDAPGSRIGHSAVLDPDNGIIIYGGVSSEDGLTFASPDLTFLSIKTKPYQWVTPSVKNRPPQRSFHTATLVGKNMLIAFGKVEGRPDIVNPLNIFDLSDGQKFQWVLTYTVPTSDSKNLLITKNLALIIGGSVGGVVSLVIIIIIIVKLCKIWKENENIRSHQNLDSLGSLGGSS